MFKREGQFCVHWSTAYAKVNIYCQNSDILELCYNHGKYICLTLILPSMWCYSQVQLQTVMGKQKFSAGVYSK
jgi:hypothetical protein